MALFIFIFVIIIVYSTGSIVERKNNYDSSKNFKNKITNTYIDSKGGIRDCKTNQPLFHSFNEKGEKIFENMSGKEIVNISQAHNEANRKEAINSKYKTTYNIYNPYTANDSMKKCIGYFYKDLKNNRIYTTRLINNYIFYMDVETGLLVRLCDEELIHIKDHSEIIKVNNILNEFNKKQSDRREHIYFSPYNYYLNEQSYIKDKYWENKRR